MRILDRDSKFVISVLLFAAIGFVLPWWSIALVAAAIGWLTNGLGRAVKCAFTSCFLAWFLLTLGFDAVDGFRISPRLGGMVGLPVPIIANLLSALLGAIVAGLVAATFNQLRITIQLSRPRS